MTGSPPRHSFYEPADTVLFYGFVIPQERRDDVVASLYRELVDPTVEHTTNGLASLYVSDALRETCRMPAAAFRAVRRSRDQPTQMMLCIGSNLKPFSLTVNAVAAVAEKLAMQPLDLEWCFSNRTKDQFLDYESDEEGSMDEGSTKENSTEPMTDEDLANVTSSVHVGEWTDWQSDGTKRD